MNEETLEATPETTEPTNSPSTEPTPEATTTEEPTPPETPTTEEAEKAEGSLLAGDKTKAQQDASRDEAVPLDLKDVEVPEGFDVEAPEAKEFLNILGDENLSRQELAGKLMGLYAEQVKSLSAAADKTWLDAQNTWQDALEREHGANNLDMKLAGVAKLFDAYDTARREAVPAGTSDVPEFGKDLRDALTLTGAGNNPEIVNFCIWLSDQLGEGNPLSGRPTGGDLTLAQRMFGT